jgi:hypothetical protein
LTDGRPVGKPVTISMLGPSARARHLGYKDERKFPKGQRMSAYDRELHEKLQKLESIDVRLAQHDKITRLGLVSILALGTLVLALLTYLIVRH